MALKESGKSENSDSGNKNGGKKYLEDRKWLEENIEKHTEDISNLQSDVSDIKTKVAVLDDIKDLSKKTNEIVVRMDERKDTFVTKEKYLEDKVIEAKEEVKEITGVHQLPPEFPTASAEIRIEKSGWRESITKNIKLFLLILAFLAALGVYPTITWVTNGLSDKAEAAGIKEIPAEMKEFLKEQKEFLENVNRLMKANGIKTGTAIVSDKDKSLSGG